MTKLNKVIILVFLFCSVLILFSSLTLFKNFSSNKTIVTIGGKKFVVEVASNVKQWQQGLSDRKSLCKDCGMLFVFPDKKTKQFWMKDMKFPLDIIWISDSRVVGVSRNLAAPEVDQLPEIIDSSAAVDQVLEVNAGMSISIKDGDIVEIIRN